MTDPVGYACALHTHKKKTCIEIATQCTKHQLLVTSTPRAQPYCNCDDQYPIKSLLYYYNIYPAGDSTEVPAEHFHGKLKTSDSPQLG